METSRFENLDLDEGTRAAPSTTARADTRWTHPECEGLEIPVYEGITDSRQMSDYVVSHGPAARALEATGHHKPLALVPLATAGGEPCRGIEGYRAVVDLSTGRMLGRPVTTGYHLAQNATIAAMIDAFIGADAKVGCHVSHDGMRVIFRVPLTDGFLSPDQIYYIEEKRDFYHTQIHRWRDKPGFVPPIDHELVILNTHGAFGRFRGKTRCRFKACDNGLILGLNDTGFAWTHSAYLAERIEQAREAFELSQGNIGGVVELFDRMFRHECSASQFSEFMAEMYPEVEDPVKQAIKAKKVQAARERLRELYYHAPGCEPDTAYGCLMAATFVATHELPNKAKTPELQKDRRFELSIEGAGQQFNERALQWCYNTIGVA